MTLGKPGGGEAPDRFFQPNAVAIASNGDIFVAQNHTAHDDKSRVLVFSPEGKFIKSFGGMGSGAGELDVPACAGLRCERTCFGRRPQP
jgi:hypothetical protein